MTCNLAMVAMAKTMPFNECAAQAEKLRLLGATIRQQFTCEHCGAGQTMEQANVFYTSGRCEHCNQITDLQAKGCSFVIIATINEKTWRKRACAQLTLAHQLAKKAVKEEWRRQGLKLQDINAKELSQAAQAYFDEHLSELLAIVSERYRSIVESDRTRHQQSLRKPTQ